MGLYQYIREQVTRDDPVGQLARWMKENANQEPDHQSPEFMLAAREFQNCESWTKRDALARLKSKKRVQGVLRTNPKVAKAFSNLIAFVRPRGYDRHQHYEHVKRQLLTSGALGDPDTYKEVIESMVDLLPPDFATLYPNDPPENIKIDL